MDLNKVTFPMIADSNGFFNTVGPIIPIIDEILSVEDSLSIAINDLVYCTPTQSTFYIIRDLYNARGEHVREKEYFILGESLLGESLGYELV